MSKGSFHLYTAAQRSRMSLAWQQDILNNRMSDQKETAVQDLFETLFDEAYDGLGCFDPLVCPETRDTLLTRLRQQLPENELPFSTQRAYERIRDVLEQVTDAARSLLSEAQQEESKSGAELSAETLAAFNALVAAVPREESGRFVLGG